MIHKLWNDIWCRASFPLLPESYSEPFSPTAPCPWRDAGHNAHSGWPGMWWLVVACIWLGFLLPKCTCSLPVPGPLLRRHEEAPAGTEIAEWGGSCKSKWASSRYLLVKSELFLKSLFLHSCRSVLMAVFIFLMPNWRKKKSSFSLGICIQTLLPPLRSGRHMCTSERWIWFESKIVTNTFSELYFYYGCMLWFSLA